MVMSWRSRSSLTRPHRAHPPSEQGSPAFVRRIPPPHALPYLATDSGASSPAKGLGVSPPVILSPGAVSTTETTTGYLAEVTAPSGETAQSMVDKLPGLTATANVVKLTLNSLVSDLNVQTITICVAVSGAGCSSSGGDSGDDPGDDSGGNSGSNSTGSSGDDKCRQHARQEGRRSSRLGCVPARATAPGLSGGAIAGIVIGVLVLLAIIGGVFFMMKKKAAVTPK